MRPIKIHNGGNYARVQDSNAYNNTHGCELMMSEAIQNINPIYWLQVFKTNSLLFSNTVHVTENLSEVAINLKDRLVTEKSCYVQSVVHPIVCKGSFLP